MYRSVQWSVDQVRRGVHGLGGSVFGSPEVLKFMTKKKNTLQVFVLQRLSTPKKRYYSQLEQVITISNTHLLVTFLKILKGFSMTNLSQI